MSNQYTATSTWTDERRELAAALWKDKGLSATQIAAQLGGVTRNAVIGLIHRSGLAGAGARKPGSHYTQATRSKRQQPKTKTFVNAVSVAHHREARKFDPKPDAPVVRLKVATPEPVSLCVPLLELKPWHCRWPSAGPPFTSCGAAAAEGPYCEHHAQRAFVPAVARRRMG